MKAIDKALLYLSKRDHSIRELVQKLKKNYSPDEIEAALIFLQENNWLKKPEKLAEDFAQQLGRKNRGILQIQRKLMQKGLPRVKANPEHELEKACSLVQRRFSDLSTLEQKAKAYRFLAQRGFTTSTISLALKKVPGS